MIGHIPLSFRGREFARSAIDFLTLPNPFCYTYNSKLSYHVVYQRFFQQRERQMRVLRSNHGQGMTEYIIIVALIAIAAIAAFAFFGKTIRNQTAAMSESVAGDTGKAHTAVTDAGKAADKAVGEGQKDRDLKSYVEPAK